MFRLITTLFFCVCQYFCVIQASNSLKGISDSCGNKVNKDTDRIRDFYRKILDIIPNAKSIKDLSNVATVRYKMRDEVNNAIIFSVQFFKKNKHLINDALLFISQNTEIECVENDIQSLSNDVANLIILKSLQILSIDEKLGINFQSYKVFEQLGVFSKKINFLFNINELTYPEHLMSSYDATEDLKYLKMLIKYLDITEEDEKNLTESVSKIDFDNISDQERDNFRKFVFFKHVKNIIKEHKDLFESRKNELLKASSNDITRNFENILKEN